MTEKMLRSLVIKKSLLVLLFLMSFSLLKAQKTYKINYYDNGSVKSHGWMNNGLKDGYWKFYYENSILKEEGHFFQNQKHNYWFYYETNGKKIKEGHYDIGKKTKWWSFYNNKVLLVKKITN